MKKSIVFATCGMLFVATMVNAQTDKAMSKSATPAATQVAAPAENKNAAEMTFSN